MKNKDIAGELRLAAAVLERWPDGPLPEIEKDILLEKLRTVYGVLKFGTDGTETTPCPVSDGPEAKTRAASDGPDTAVRTAVGDDTNRKAVVTPAAPAADRVTPPVPVPAPAADAVQEPFSPEVTPNPAVDGAGEEPSCIVTSEDEREEFRENILFDEEQMPVRQKLDRRAILSLYGDDPQPVKKVRMPEPGPVAAAPEEIHDPIDMTTDAPASEPVTDIPVGGPIENTPPPAPPQAPDDEPATGRFAEGGAGNPAVDHILPQHPDPRPEHELPEMPVAMPPEPETTQVLGDVLGGGQTVSDMYAAGADKADVASVVGGGRVASLRGAIGINDKFLLIRNLFDGNAEIYESVMSTLDGFDDLDDALIYIHENFHWNPDSDAVRMLMDLLTRKLA